MDLQLENKKALVFGSSTGIGYAIAQSLLTEKALVCVNSRNADRLATTQANLNTKFGVTADLTKANAANEAVHQAVKQMNGIDILVMNTGGPNKGNFSDITNDQWQLDFQNLWLSFTDAVKAALPTMQKQKFGRIVLVTSLAAKEPISALTTSNGLRAGLAGLCKSLANEMAPYGITVNVLLPGYTNTNRLKNLKLSEEQVKQMVPAGRLGDPRELADLATFLASPKAGYVTGQSIAVDGGVLKGH
ncbi:MAG: SDR family oxidoreductase [Bdellovibrionaceae bacterium]|nr:SDR family oxidoreductase [Bdellovibrio sp.]